MNRLFQKTGELENWEHKHKHKPELSILLSRPKQATMNMVTAIVRSTVIVFLLAIISQVGATAADESVAVARETVATPTSCGSKCLRVSSVRMYRTPPAITAKVFVTGSSFAGRMRGSVVSGEFTTPDNQKVAGFGWVGTRDARIRITVPAGGLRSGTYTFKVTNVVMRGDATYKFDPTGSTVLNATIAIP